MAVSLLAVPGAVFVFPTSQALHSTYGMLAGVVAACVVRTGARTRGRVLVQVGLGHGYDVSTAKPVADSAVHRLCVLATRLAELACLS